MKRATVTERWTYEVDVDDLLIRLAKGLNGAGWALGDFSRSAEVETVLVEIEDGKETCQLAGKPAASHRRDALQQRPEKSRVTLSIERAQELLRFVQHHSKPGDLDPINASWRYLYALQDAIRSATRTTHASGEEA